jgi:hypothetical protein
MYDQPRGLTVLADLIPVHDTFRGIIPGQSSTPIGRIDLEVSCGSGENMYSEMLTFEVASFDIGYNCILGWPFFLAYENAPLTHAKRFGEKEAQELAVKVDKTHRGSTPVRTADPKPPTGGTLQPPAEKKSTFMGSTSNQHTTDQSADDKKKGTTDQEVAVDPNDTDKKLRLSMELDPK